jgi:hypothetical protein
MKEGRCMARVLEFRNRRRVIAIEVCTGYGGEDGG